MLGQNVLARSDAEIDEAMANTKSETWKQIYRCEKASSLTRRATSDVNICLKAIENAQKDPKITENFKLKVLAIEFLNTGVLYDCSKKDYIKAYEYYIKSAKLGDTQAQVNLDILCKEHSWACK